MSPVWARNPRRIALILFTLTLVLAVMDRPLAFDASATNLKRVEELKLPKKEGALRLYYSPAAEDAAAAYAAELEAAVAWYRAQLGWSGPVTMAVLDKADFAKVTRIPYPSPHTETRTGLIIMADRIDEHPGFDQWDLEPMGLNTAFTFHEIGHVIARDLAIWSPNAWINELVANVFLAAYVRAERPQYGGFQRGLPPRFDSAGRYRRLDDFDDLYFSMGQLNYLWFQFQIARIADYLVSDGDFRAVVEGLRREFPMVVGRRRESVKKTFERLERIRPEVTAVAAGLAGR